VLSLLAPALATALLAPVLAGCGGSGKAAVTRSPAAEGRAAAVRPLSVVASAFPLAQLVSYLGGRDVKVTNLVAPGAQPQGLALSPAGRRALSSAQFVVEVGDGYQPEVEAAAARRPHFSLVPSVSRQAQPYEVWLDPYLWGDAATQLAKALGSADPGASHRFQNGARDFQSLASSIASDYQNSLSACPLRYFVTADTAFGRMASAFSLVDVPVSTTGVQKTLAVVAQYSVPDVFSEQGVSAGEVEQVARAAHIGVKNLDPMELTPAPGTKYQSYFSVMEANLSALEGPLECDTSDNLS
jgi:ABC-type Zn uptake system ZnuABC Zn-binding protein ZnuA